MRGGGNGGGGGASVVSLSFVALSFVEDGGAFLGRPRFRFLGGGAAGAASASSRGVVAVVVVVVVVVVVSGRDRLPPTEGKGGTGVQKTGVTLDVAMVSVNVQEGAVVVLVLLLLLLLWLVLLVLSSLVVGLWVRAAAAATALE